VFENTGCVAFCAEWWCCFFWVIWWFQQKWQIAFASLTKICNMSEGESTDSGECAMHFCFFACLHNHIWENAMLDAILLQKQIYTQVVYNLSKWHHHSVNFCLNLWILLSYTLGICFKFFLDWTSVATFSCKICFTVDRVCVKVWQEFCNMTWVTCGVTGQI
jgi:hypothetical protein